MIDIKATSLDECIIWLNSFKQKCVGIIKAFLILITTNVIVSNWWSDKKSN